MVAVVHREAQDELIERVKQAAALPVVISIKDVYDETCTELLVLANLDSGARGRPSVSYDVTAALNAMQLRVFMADVYIESPVGDAEQRPQELHRFLVHCVDGCRLSSSAEKRCGAFFSRLYKPLFHCTDRHRLMCLDHSQGDWRLRS